jgi:hypothetical protein
MAKAPTVKPQIPREDQQRAIRVNVIAEKILDGICRKDLDHFCTHDLGLSKTAAAAHIKDAATTIDSLFRERFEGKLPSIAAGFQTIYERAMRDSDYKAANEALKNLSMLMGLMTTKSEVKSKTVFTSELQEIPTDELIRLASSENQ